MKKCGVGQCNVSYRIMTFFCLWLISLSYVARKLLLITEEEVTTTTTGRTERNGTERKDENGNGNGNVNEGTCCTCCRRAYATCISC